MYIIFVNFNFIGDQGENKTEIEMETVQRYGYQSRKLLVHRLLMP